MGSMEENGFAPGAAPANAEDQVFAPGAAPPRAVPVGKAAKKGPAAALLDLLYPPKCAFCRHLTRDGRMICPACEKALPYTGKESRIQRLSPLAFCLSPLYYTGDVRRSLQRYKFHGAAAYCGVYGELMADCLCALGPEAAVDLIAWTPLSRRRLRRRGYDQAKLLAQEIAGRTGLPCRALLRKQRHNPAQSGIRSPEARRSNVQGVYRVAEDAGQLRGISVLLVDDIVTTGATLSEAASVLLDAGAERVVGLTLARSETPMP